MRVGACRQHQRRLIDLRRIVWGPESRDRIECRVQPRHRWPANPERRIVCDQTRHCAHNAWGRRSADFGKARRPAPIDIAARHIVLAEACKA